MTFWSILILLVLVAGLVAYMGDLVAKRVGKRHWRVLGLRPRATATLVAVGTGVLIAIGAFGTFFFLAKDARETIFQAQQVRAERDQLKADVGRLSRERERFLAQSARDFAERQQLLLERVQLRNDLKLSAKQLDQYANQLTFTRLELERVLTQQEQLRREADQLKTDNAKQEAAVKQLQQSRDKLVAEKIQLQSGREQLLAQVARVEKQLQDLEQASKVARTRYSSLLAQTKELTQKISNLEGDKRNLEGDVAVLVAGSGTGKNYEVANRELSRNLEAIQSENADMRSKLADAQRELQVLRERGKLLTATLDKALQQTLLAEEPVDVGGEQAALQEVLRRAENRARLLGLRGIETTQTPTLSNFKQGLLLARSAGINAEGKVQVRVEYRAKERVYSAGDVLATGTLVLPASLGDMRRKLESLSQQAEGKLADAGWIPEKLAQGGVSFEEFANFVSQATQVAKKGYKLAVVALDDLFPTDPPKLGIKILP